MPSGRQWCALTRHASALMVSIGSVYAQDPFEIHVLEYEQLQRGEFTFENHLNYVAQSATQGASPGAQSVFHDTYELTAGITEDVSFGVMQLNAGGPVALSNPRVGGSSLISTFRVPGICPSKSASWPSLRLRIRRGTRTPGALRFCPFWKRASAEFRSISIPPLAGPSTDPIPIAAGESDSPGEWPLKRPGDSRPASNTMATGGHCPLLSHSLRRCTRFFLVATSG
jgi:hypothetical protein